ncbi:nuclear transport factor 2 family protein [Novosphingobium sp. JCM 18896]|uniref:nuclear transport factor 2 family protein n=1 Tax=Novosphingobium sp. JCM 18896 TaxID=2989731 RepID=UPI002221B7DA|nr:nuclear transport factor 2 family protein [Novosphingobium sp. JCM 18896]MCW1428369.1 nuclear transport factor 2 family protein [Novosphingobium sp. JCM 18896]
MSDQGSVIDRMFAALAAGKVEAALACLSDDAKIWHGFDCLAHDKAAMRAQYRGLVDGFPARDFVDVRRQATPTGFVQQHVMTATTPSGQRKAWPACIVVRIENGLITRLDEYIDRAGAFEPPATGALVTPGLDD